MFHSRRPRVLSGHAAALRRTPTQPSSAALIGAAALLTVLLAGPGCASGGDERARRAGSSDAPGTNDEVAQPGSQDTGVGASTGGTRVIAGLGGPLAQLVDRAGVPGLGETSTNGVAVSSEQRTCLERQASALPPQALSVVTAGGGLGELTPTGGTIVADAISRCVDAGFLGERLGEEYVIRLGLDATLDPGFATCIAGELDGATGALVTEVARQSTGTTTELLGPVAEAVDPCGATHLVQLLTDHYAAQGLNAEAASCVGVGLAERVSLSEVLNSGSVAKLEAEFSPTLQLDLEDLFEQCGAPPRDGT